MGSKKVVSIYSGFLKISVSVLLRYLNLLMKIFPNRTSYSITLMNGFLCFMYPSELKNLVGFTESLMFWWNRTRSLLSFNPIAQPGFVRSSLSSSVFKTWSTSGTLLLVSHNLLVTLKFPAKRDKRDIIVTLYLLVLLVFLGPI